MPVDDDKIPSLNRIDQQPLGLQSGLQFIAVRSGSSGYAHAL